MTVCTLDNAHGWEPSGIFSNIRACILYTNEKVPESNIIFSPDISYQVKLLYLDLIF
jgi:hypothetical protein